MFPIFSAIKFNISFISARPDWIGRVCFIALLSVLFSCSGGKEGDFSVKDGLFQQSVVEKGELEAISASFIAPPQLMFSSQLKIIWLAEHGTMVHKGDTIVKFDPAPTERNVQTYQTALETALATRKKQDITMENADQEVQAQMKSEQASYDLSKLQMDRVKFEPEKQRKIKELQFQQSTIRIDKLKRKLERLPRMNQYDRTASDIWIRQKKDLVTKIEDDLDKLVLLAPSDGLLQIGRNVYSESGQSYKTGDQVYSYARYPIATIPDISRMKVSTSIREVDFTKVKLGAKVIVRLDALPSVSFKGVVTDISKICLNGRDGAKSFGVEVQVMDRDERLKPGMTVNCEYICYESKKDLFVPNNCLLRTDTADYVFVKKTGSPLKVAVSAGPSNNHYTVIRSDLKVGQQLVPFEEVLNEKTE